MTDFVPKQKESEKKPFKLDIKTLCFIIIGIDLLNILFLYFLFTAYQGLVKTPPPLDLQVKQAIQSQKDLYKMNEKIKKISNGKLEEE